MKKIKQQDKNKAELMWIIILLIGIIILFSGIHIADAQRGRGGSIITAPVVDTTKMQDVYEVTLHVDNKANVNLEGSVVIEGIIDDLISSGLQKPTVIISSGVFVDTIK